MSAPDDRRAFLRRLAGLPLVGGGVTLIGQPTAAAVPVTERMLDSYDSWLFFERRFLRFERRMSRPRPGYGVASWQDVLGEYDGGIVGDHVPCDNPGARYHSPRENMQPSIRAAVILSAAGVPIA